MDDVPESVREDIEMLTEKTSLADAEAEVYVLFMSNYTYAQIAEIRGVAKNTVENTLRNARDRIEEAHKTAQKLPVKNKDLATSEDYLEVTSVDYLGLDWTDWEDPEDLSDICYREHQGPGLYRIKDADSDNLLYVGFSGDLQDSVRGLFKHAQNLVKKFRHITYYLTNKKNQVDARVSMCTPDLAEYTEHLLGMAYAAIAVHRREKGFTPPLNLRDRKSIRENTKDLLTGEYKKEESTEPLSWESWEDVRSREWMVGEDTKWMSSQDIDESARERIRIDVDLGGVKYEPPKARKLFAMWDKNQLNPAAQRIYRVWDKEYETWAEDDISPDPYLTYIGHNISFDNAELAEESLFSFIDVGEIVSEITSVSYREIFVELLGAHYLATGTLPVKQYSSVSPYRETYPLPDKLFN